MSETQFGFLFVWSFAGIIFFLASGARSGMRDLTYPQFFYIGFLLGPIIFLGTIGVFIYNMLGKINWK